MFPYGVGNAIYIINYFDGVKEMNKELILKLLAALGVKIGTNEGELKEDDAIKLVEDSFNAGNAGLINKRDELLKQEKELKSKIETLEGTVKETGKKQTELEAQLKKSNPEEFKAYYEGQAKELKDKHAAELESVNTELNRFRDSHYARVRNDELKEAIKDIQFLEGLQDGFIALAMSENQFNPVEVDGKTTFRNQNKETISGVIHQFALSNRGKVFIKNGNQGSGAQGAANQNTNTNAGNNNPYKKETLNRTAQMVLEKSNPEQAARLKAEAGV